MAFDFPSSPIDGQTFTPPGGPTYRFVDPKWTVLGSSASVEISDTAPSNPSPGNLWWEADTGKLFVWYSDGTSSQWVEAAGGGRGPAASGWRNRIINGDFSIDQRFAGAGLTIPASGAATYSMDRWWGAAGATGTFICKQGPDGSRVGNYVANLQVVTADAAIAATDFYMFGQFIEGYNVRDLMWGSATAQPITISFDVMAQPLAGTFSLMIKNGAADRTWLGSVTVNAVGVWEHKTITVPGDTTGTWLATNGRGMDITIGLAIGSNYHGVAGWQAGSKIALAGMTNFMATTGNQVLFRDFQVEVGTQATEFERVPYDEQLVRCRRYYEISSVGTVGVNGFSGNVTSGGGYYARAYFTVTKRASPTVVLTNVGSTLSFPATPSSPGVDVLAFYDGRVANATGTGLFANTWTASAEL